MTTAAEAHYLLRRKAMDEGGFGSIHDFTVGFDRGYEAAAKPYREALNSLMGFGPFGDCSCPDFWKPYHKVGRHAPECDFDPDLRAIEAQARALLRREVGE